MFFDNPDGLLTKSDGFDSTLRRVAGKQGSKDCAKPSGKPLNGESIAVQGCDENSLQSRKKSDKPVVSPSPWATEHWAREAFEKVKPPTYF